LNDWPRDCAAVIPCLNEQGTIGSLVRAIAPSIPTIWVVDDGSQDNTREEAKKAGATVVSKKVSVGKGAALHAGWSQALEHGFQWGLSLDGDGQHAPEDISKFLGCADRTGASIVIGNRMHTPSRMPLVRRWVNRLMSEQLSRLTGRPVPDSQCGFRLMNLREWAKLPIRSSHFEIESEVLLHFARAGLKIEFVPIQVIYKEELSKIHPIKDTVRWLRWRQQAGRAGEAELKRKQPLNAQRRGC
jgi:glycosyltransferase involved in cell wall biosynthesis